jgi:CMP-N,N'-diacetyllegionaminic acid synthase
MSKSTESHKKSSPVLAIIPARGGSKGIPRKNIRILAGKSLIVWTIETALQCSVLDKIIVSTDDEKIAEICRHAGADVPFLRPKELALDDTPDFPVYEHTLKWLSENQDFQPEIVVWLRPTAPLRTITDIDSAVHLIKKSNADAVRSVCHVEHHPYWMKLIQDTHLLPLIENCDESRYYHRQLLPPVYRLNGAVDVIRCKSVRKTGLLYSGDVLGYIMPNERSIDLDSELDFDLAELYLRRGSHEKKHS